MIQIFIKRTNSVMKCSYIDCSNRADYGDRYSGNMKCCRHRTTEKRQKGTVCRHDTCSKLANYGIGYQKLTCKAHSKKGYILLSKKKCEIVGCNLISTYGYDRAIRCKRHCCDDMCYVYRTCEVNGCRMKRKYGVIQGIKKMGYRCYEHRYPNDIDIGVLCEIDGCLSVAYYGFSRPVRCLIHSKPNDDTFINLSDDINGISSFDRIYDIDVRTIPGEIHSNILYLRDEGASESTPTPGDEIDIGDFTLSII